MPVMIAMSVITEKTLLRVIYLVATGFGFAALMTADSDSGILGMAVFMIIYLVWFSNSLVRLKRFFLSATVMLLFAIRKFESDVSINIKYIFAHVEFQTCIILTVIVT